jgi:hypothetical protein
MAKTKAQKKEPRRKTEDYTINTLEKKYMTEKRQQIYIALEDVDFIWCPKEVKDVDAMWNMGLSIEVIADSFERSINDVFVLLWDRLEKGSIKERKGSIWGVQ